MEYNRRFANANYDEAGERSACGSDAALWFDKRWSLSHCIEFAKEHFRKQRKDYKSFQIFTNVWCNRPITPVIKL